MATAKLYNIARVYTGTTGTGTITLGSAVAGHLTFAGAGVSDAETVTYAIRDGSNSEIGRGVYTSSGTTLTRSVIKSTNSDAAINLSGTAEVFITPAAQDYDVNDFTAETAPATADLVWLHDASASARRKMTLANMLAVVNSLTEDTATLTSDYLLEYDASAAAVKKTTTATIEKTMNGPAKAWVYISPWSSGGTPTAADSYNIASITDQGTGNARPNMTSIMATANYCCAINTVPSASWSHHSCGAAPVNATTIEVLNYETTPALTDAVSAGIAAFGDLA